MNAHDKLSIAERISDYFFALDDLADPERLLAFFTHDAVWECFNYNESSPALRFTRLEDMGRALAMARVQGQGVMLKHHLSGLVFTQLTPDQASTRAKVLVTAQRETDPAPAPRNTADCYGEWAKVNDQWLLRSWTIRRGPAR